MTPQEVASTFLGQDRLSVAGQVSNKNPFIVPGIESLFPLKKAPCLKEFEWRGKGVSTLGPVKQQAELLSLTQWDLFQRFDGIRIVRGLIGKEFHR